MLLSYTYISRLKYFPSSKTIYNLIDLTHPIWGAANGPLAWHWGWGADTGEGPRGQWWPWTHRSMALGPQHWRPGPSHGRWSRAGAHGNRTRIAHPHRRPQTLRKKVPHYGRGTEKRSACAFFETFSIANFNKLAFEVFQIKSLKKKKKIIK